MNNLSIVMYHYVRPIADSRFPKIKGLELAGFRRQLDYLSSKYDLVTSSEVIAWAEGRSDLPEKACYLTFDDGYKDHIDYVLPELLSRNLHGAFFPPVKPVVERKLLDVNRVHFVLAETGDASALVSDLETLCLDRGMSEAELKILWDEYGLPSRFDPAEVIYIKRMLQHALPESWRNEIASDLFAKYVQRDESDFADDLYLSLEDTKSLVSNGMFVGSHGNNHIWLNRESIDVQKAEIDSSLGFLQTVGAPTENWIMCYPYGGFNADSLVLLKERKCAVGLTTKVAMADLSKTSPFELPRFDTNDFPQ